MIKEDHKAGDDTAAAMRRPADGESGVLDADDEVKSAEGEAEDELQLRHESAEHPHANGQTDLLIQLSLLQKENAALITENLELKDTLNRLHKSQKASSEGGGCGSDGAGGADAASFDPQVPVIQWPKPGAEMIACAGDQSAVVTRDGFLFTWGCMWNHNEDALMDSVYSPLQVTLGDGITCRMIACGFGHAAAVTTEGHLFTWGWGTDGCLGQGAKEARYAATRVGGVISDACNKVAMASCGRYHSAAVTTSGRVFVWGNGDDGQLGLGKKHSTLVPTIVHGALANVRVAMIACGFHHTAALTDQGRVWTWGLGEEGQLGHGDFECKLVPTLIEGPLIHVTIIMTACGNGHTTAVTSRGGVLAWGRASNGQLGLGDRKKRNVPTRIIEGLDGHKVMMTACGNFHSAATTEEGRVLTWGSGERGQLGLGSSDEDRHTPMLVTGQADELIQHKVTSVGCGVYHTAVVTDKGLVFSWGLGADGQLGCGDGEPALLPKRVPKLGPKALSPRKRKRSVDANATETDQDGLVELPDEEH